MLVRRRQRSAELPQQPERIIYKTAFGDLAALDPEEVRAGPEHLLTSSPDSLELTSLRSLDCVPDDDFISLGYGICDCYAEVLKCIRMFSPVFSRLLWRSLARAVWSDDTPSNQRKRRN